MSLKSNDPDWGAALCAAQAWEVQPWVDPSDFPWWDCRDPSLPAGPHCLFGPIMDTM